MNVAAQRKCLYLLMEGIFKAFDRPLGNCDDASCIAEERLAVSRELYGAGRAVKELHVKLCFERVDLVRDRGLRNPAQLGSLRKIQGFGNRKKACELKCIHRFSFFY